MLGKRKRRGQVVAIESDERLKLDGKESSNLQTLFRQHFEASFEPLDELCLAPSKQEASEAQSDVTESEWRAFQMKSKLRHRS